MTPPTCPLCGAEMCSVGNDRWHCYACGLAGASDTLEKVRALSQRAEDAEDVLRELAGYLGAGGYNAETVDAKVFADKIRWRIDHLIEVETKFRADLESRIAELQTPRAVLEAAEKLFADANVLDVFFREGEVFVQQLMADGTHRHAEGATLAEAYEKLVEVRRGE